MAEDGKSDSSPVTFSSLIYKLLLNGKGLSDLYTMASYASTPGAMKCSVSVMFCFLDVVTHSAETPKSQIMTLHVALTSRFEVPANDKNPVKVSQVNEHPVDDNRHNFFLKRLPHDAFIRDGTLRTYSIAIHTLGLTM